MIINRRAMARAKVEKLKKGLSAYAETREVAELVEKYIKENNLNVFIDRTPLGTWFIPEEEQKNIG
ncbi:MAG: hypothetical protein H0Z33_08295 [Bacillaceae bacterium]|nr:hypothetical protein [Bacillaceae bacterium]